MKYLSNPDMLLGLMRQMLSGMEVTLPLFFYTLIFSLPLGVIVALMRMCKLKIVSVPTRVCILVLRGTPLMIQLFLIYFGLPALGVNLDAATAGILGIGINSSGYVGEIVRGGIEGVPKGQWEAAKMLGLSYRQTMKSIILPQAIRHMLPAIGNEFVTLIKESSLLSVLAISDLTMVGQQVRSVTYASFETFIFVALVYLVLTSVTSGALQLLENRWKVK